ncbi:unnamed protein product, partial [Nesidiocoris tenuis]
MGDPSDGLATPLPPRRLTLSDRLQSTKVYPAQERPAPRLLARPTNSSTKIALRLARNSEQSLRIVATGNPVAVVAPTQLLIEQWLSCLWPAVAGERGVTSLRTQLLTAALYQHVRGRVLPAPQPLSHGSGAPMSERRYLPGSDFAPPWSSEFLVLLPHRLFGLTLRDTHSQFMRFEPLSQRRHLHVAQSGKIFVHLLSRVYRFHVFPKIRQLRIQLVRPLTVRNRCVVHLLDRCMCEPGYTGINCESEYFPCDPSPCQNGVCKQVDSLNYECKCPTEKWPFFHFCRFVRGAEEGYEVAIGGDPFPQSTAILCGRYLVRDIAARLHLHLRQGLCQSRYVSSHYIANYVCYNSLYWNSGPRSVYYAMSTTVVMSAIGAFPLLASIDWFRGKNCEENIDDCPGNLCQNNATCLDDVNRYRCVCPPTYTGEFCEQDLDECSLRPSVCHNGATCTNTIGGYSCICVNGWTGKDCSENIDDCQGAACFNGATCIDRVGSFYCQCTPGKTVQSTNFNFHPTLWPCGSEPKACTEIISADDRATETNCCFWRSSNSFLDVAGSPCEHDGVCVNTPGSFMCNCTQGFTGPRCETNVNECESHPCQNDGSCLDDPGTFRCVCMPGIFCGQWILCPYMEPRSSTKSSTGHSRIPTPPNSPHELLDGGTLAANASRLPVGFEIAREARGSPPSSRRPWRKMFQNEYFPNQLWAIR